MNVAGFAHLVANRKLKEAVILFESLQGSPSGNKRFRTLLGWHQQTVSTQFDQFLTEDDDLFDLSAWVRRQTKANRPL